MYASHYGHVLLFIYLLVIIIDQSIKSDVKQGFTGHLSLTFLVTKWQIVQPKDPTINLIPTYVVSNHASISSSMYTYIITQVMDM